MKQLYFLAATFFLFTIANAQIVNIPDANFKAELLASSPSYHVGSTVLPNSSATPGVYTVIDANNDGEIQASEAAAILFLSVNFSEIANLQGIEAFTNMKYLYCNGNNLTSLDLSNCHALQAVNCEDNQIASLNVLGCTNLTSIGCSQNNLTTLNLSGMTQLSGLYLRNNHLTSLDTTGLNNLMWLDLLRNNLTSFSINDKPNLQNLNLGYNQLTSVTLINLPILYKMNFQFNAPLTALDLSSCAYQYPVNADVLDIDCGNNPNLTHLNLKNGYANDISIFSINSSNHPQYFCMDEDDHFDQFCYYNDNSLFSTYCNFTPGTHFNTINGTITYDEDNNGCDVSDFVLTHTKVSISDGTNSGYVSSNQNGAYAFFVQQPNLTISPILENAYFTVSPASALLNFPSNDNSVQVQNFCLTANGIHPDLEITVLPVTDLRPGFNVQYKIIYKNKGTQTQSGSVSLAFNDAMLDLVSAIPAVSSQISNYLNWDFTDLHPFESRIISVVLNANSPLDTPPLNGGDVLTLTAAVNGMLTDQNNDDNTSLLQQTVVNSFDPNDKTCLEGNTITPEMVGKEVHYMIRFENTGTANAENVVVKDMIDTTKFDINSLIPIDGSHPFVTRISNTNKVEFIFENIQLPFDDANNDGYVAFKIKTKPTLVLGDTFSNTASIYFDYNLPIITNTATTAIALLANQDFYFEDYFKIYPNPVNDVLSIDAKQTIKVTSVNIYNTLGQIVLVIPNAQHTKSIDVSSLKTGNYFLKINSDKGTSNVKFIKM